MKDEQQLPDFEFVIPSEASETETSVAPTGKETREPRRKRTAPVSLNPASKSRPVVLYIGIMFSVALILLLLSFLMQQRNHEALMEGLTDLQDVQSIVDLTMENRTLQEALAQIKLDQAALQTEYDNLLVKKDAAADQAIALQYLIEIRHAYDAGQNKKARSLIADFESTGLAATLPSTAEIEGGTSPAQLFTDIKEKLS